MPVMHVLILHDKISQGFTGNAPLIGPAVPFGLKHQTFISKAVPLDLLLPLLILTLLVVIVFEVL